MAEIQPLLGNHIHSAFNDGLVTRVLSIECGLTRGFAGVQLLGNAAESCRDGKERARTALENLGIFLPAQRLVMSLTPGDLKKEGNHLDLAMALGMATQVAKRPQWMIQPYHWLFAAELGLNGELRPVKGIISFALSAMSHGLKGIVVAWENLQELQVLADLKLGSQSTSLEALEDPASETHPVPPTQPFEILAFRCLKDVLHWLSTGESSREDHHQGSQSPGVKPLVYQTDQPPRDPEGTIPNFDDMVLSTDQRLVAVTACAGMHSLLLRGCPGTGKSMFAQRLTSILPAMSAQVHIEVLKVYSQISERIPRELLIGRAPFRAPHHQASAPAILGTPEVPGELSLAHGGVLFLDEFPEFRRDILESLREPLETGEIRVSRSKKKAEWLCQVMLVAACNNCPCGWVGSSRRLCRCSQARVQAYRGRLSGPILERIDMHINFPETGTGISDVVTQWQPSEKDSDLSVPSQTQSMIRAILGAREFAQSRHRQMGILSNSQIKAKDLGRATGLTSETLKAMITRILPNHLSNRALIRSLRVARTLADLEKRAEISEGDLAQAYRWQEDYAAFDRGETSHVSGRP